MKVVQEKSKLCTCYGCIQKSSCKCSNCVLKKPCKKTFCVFKKQSTYECSVCYSKFRTLEYLKNHRKKTNHKHNHNHVAFGTSSSKNEDLPKATWLWLCLWFVFFLWFFKYSSVLNLLKHTLHSCVLANLKTQKVFKHSFFKTHWLHLHDSFSMHP